MEYELGLVAIGFGIGFAGGFLAAHFMHRGPKLRAARKAAETRRRNKMQNAGRYLKGKD